MWIVRELVDPCSVPWASCAAKDCLVPLGGVFFVEHFPEVFMHLCGGCFLCVSLWASPHVGPVSLYSSFRYVFVDEFDGFMNVLLCFWVEVLEVLLGLYVFSVSGLRVGGP